MTKMHHCVEFRPPTGFRVGSDRHVCQTWSLAQLVIRPSSLPSGRSSPLLSRCTVHGMSPVPPSLSKEYACTTSRWSLIYLEKRAWNPALVVYIVNCDSLALFLKIFVLFSGFPFASFSPPFFCFLPFSYLTLADNPASPWKSP